MINHFERCPVSCNLRVAYIYDMYELRRIQVHLVLILKLYIQPPIILFYFVFVNSCRKNYIAANLVFLESEQR